MRFLVDAQLPPALARWLCEAGHDAEHVMDCGLLSAADHEIWDRALRIDAAIITKDEDFAQRRAMADDGPHIIWIRLPNARRRDLLVWFGKALPGILNSLDAGETLVEVI
jgi:predicted nuclease of predicted toxin-antitoxin system